MQESAGLGALLRECREARGVLLDDLSRATRIVPRQLLALEEDRLRDLPAPVFVRGFIRSYCAALAEPPERALTLYEAWVAAVEPAPVRVPATVLAEAPGPRGAAGADTRGGRRPRSPGGGRPRPGRARPRADVGLRPA